MNKFAKLVGNTPAVQVSDRIYAKLETYNPTGSIKDRIMSYIVEDAISSGEILENTILIEATSGNTGIALSAVGSAIGHKVLIIMPRNMSEERKKMMRILGAGIIEVGDSDFPGAIALRDKMINDNGKGIYWSPMQFSNPKNIQCHKENLANEIFTEFDNVSAFVSGAGTGGTIMGVKDYIVENSLSTKVVLLVPHESPHGIQGIGDCGDYLLNKDCVDHTLRIKTADAIDRAKRLTRDLGIPVGISSGANVLAAEVYRDYMCCDDGVIVTTLCDRGERYLSVYE